MREKRKNSLVLVLTALFVTGLVISPALAETRKKVLKQGEDLTFVLESKGKVVVYFYPKNERDMLGNMSCRSLWLACPQRVRPPVLSAEFYRSRNGRWEKIKKAKILPIWAYTFDIQDPNFATGNKKPAIKAYKLVIKCHRMPRLAPLSSYVARWKKKGHTPQQIKKLTEEYKKDATVEMKVGVNTHGPTPLTPEEKKEREEQTKMGYSRYLEKKHFQEIYQKIDNDPERKIPLEWYKMTKNHLGWYRKDLGESLKKIKSEITALKEKNEKAEKLLREHVPKYTPRYIAKCMELKQILVLRYEKNEKDKEEKLVAIKKYLAITEKRIKQKEIEQAKKTKEKNKKKPVPNEKVIAVAIKS